MKTSNRIISAIISLSVISSSLPITSAAMLLDSSNDKGSIKIINDFTVYESTKQSLSAKEESVKEEIAKKAEKDTVSTAELIESADNEDTYETYLKTALDQYYSDIDKNKANIEEIKQILDEKADPIIERYDSAAAERAKQDYLDYDTTSVVVTFDKNATDSYIESYLEDNTAGYKVLFDGSIDPNEKLPTSKLSDLKARIDKMGNNHFDKIYSVDLRLDQTTDIAIDELTDDKAISEADKNYFEQCEVAYNGDPNISNQYYLDSINVDDAYPIYDNSFGEKWISVLDDGIDMNHEDLKANLLSNYSYDVSEGKLLKNCSTKYTGSHGTKVSGVIAAVSGNNKGIMGVASGYGDNYNKVMMIKITNNDASASAPTSNFISAIEYAVENGADVINISWSGPNYNSNYQNIINTATSCGVTIVASAGNEGNDIARYPASYNNVLSIAAVNSNNNRAPFSSYGENIDFAAPGVSIYTTDLNNSYASVNGTSFSAPIVAASVAMLKSFTNNPTTTKIENIIDHTVTKVSDTSIGTGILNIGLAMEYARYIEFKNYIPIVSKVVSNSAKTATVRAKISATNQFAPTGFSIYRSTSQNGTYTKVKDINYNDSFLVDNWDVIQWKNTGLTSGKTYYYKVRCYVKYGNERRYTAYSNIVSVKVS